MKKIIIIIFALITILATSAHCESVIIEIHNYIISPSIIDGDIVLKITFEYNGNFLSLYWDDELVPIPLWVEVIDNQCIDAGYLYIPEP